MKTFQINFRKLLLIIAILAIKTSFAQNGFVPGYILKLNGDTLNGIINYSESMQKLDSVAFKEKESDISRNYGVLELKGFMEGGIIYRSAIVETETTSNYTDDLEAYSKLKIEKDTAFLRTVIDGPKSLYYCTNRIRKNQYYIRTDSSYELLVYKRYLAEAKVNSNVVDIAKENNRYKGQLQVYLNDCGNITSKINTAEYKLKSLEKLFLHYYECTGLNMDKHNKTENISFKAGILSGVSMTKIKFSSDVFTYLSECNFKPSYNFTAGFFVDVISPFAQKRLSLCNELTYMSYEINGHYLNYTNKNYYSNNYTTIGFSLLKINTMIRYTYPIGKLNIFLNLGMANGYTLKVKNEWKEELKYYSTNRTNVGKAISSIHKYQTGYFVGLGTKYQNYFAEMRYEYGSTISNIAGLSSSIDHYYLTVGYYF